MNVANTIAQLLHPSPPALSRVLEVIDLTEDVIAQLAVLSDGQLVNDTQLHLAFLHQPDTLIRLLELKDLYVQFAVYRLAKAILLNHDIYSFDRALTSQSQSQRLQDNRQRVIRTLVQKLISVDDRGCSGTARAILELFHGLLKDHRHLVRNTEHHGTDIDDGSDDNPSSSSVGAGTAAISQHVAVTIVEELATSEFWEATVLDRILGLREMQYPALVLFIDIEKARVPMDVVTGVSDEFESSVITCHYSLIRYLDKWMSSDRIGSLPLKKHLELICISIKPCSLPSQNSSGQQHRLEQSVDRETDMKRPLEVLTALSPIVQDLLLAFWNLDPELDEFSSGKTTFILSGDNLVRDSTPATVSCNARIKAFISNPEAVRQLGRICLTATLSILDTMSSPSNSTVNNNVISDYYGKIVELTDKYLTPFLEEWVGERTLPLLLTVYGEDDAGVSWLLTTLSRIYRRTLELSRISPQQQQQQHVLDKIHTLLEHHIHPLEALFSFLETIGFDYQTLLDLLLTLDDPHESGGMLAAVMAILRSFTEDSSDQERVLRRWRLEILDDQQVQLRQLEQYASDSESDADIVDDDKRQLQQPQPETRLGLLDNVHHCLDQLSHQIQRLFKNNLFPYNPRPLLHVLEVTQDILSIVLTDSSVE
ncbi:hypothetical protein EC957_002396 [Mortierella hygrophila]|uniref:Protein Lines C-terminal domain-containing protein n=1 Tax=Mortierella hygrophila TaxID=979708 RepID=A0A9P6F509_9FUNG|nr:hypothetical protein EC957_002396 [Mortierella hygrophila]